MAKKPAKANRDLEIVKEAKERFRRCDAWEAKARTNWKNDVKFAEGDSDNLWQWPDDIREPRETDARPLITINKTRQHNLDILNDARQAKVGVKIIPTGGEATYESAEAFMGVVRAIEYRSNADSAYQHGLKHAVQGGIGYWRVLTVYAGDDTFDKEIVVRRVKDPLLIYLDPDINEVDGSDANFGFVSANIPKDEYKRRFPKMEARNTQFNEDETWITDDHCRIAEYWRRVPKKDRLIAYMNPLTEAEVMTRESELREKAPELLKAILADEDTKTREITTYRVESYTIVGDEIAEEVEWEGIYIPIVRVIGEETCIDGILDRKGHTRALKDAQRMFNYNAAAFIEYGALQTKVPWVGAIEAVEDFLDDYWSTANVENHSILPFNSRDEQGNEIPAPQRPQPPTGAPLYLEGMNVAAEWMRMVSGQYQSDMGAPSNERSGVAIQQRQRQGDMATFHYLDHQSIAIRFTGKIFIDLIPKIYDTARVLRYKGEDGNEVAIKVDPKLDGPVATEQTETDQKITIFNPNVGRYEVEADVGKSYATKRQEAFEAYTQILSQNKELTALIGDLALQAADFPGADEAARRLKRMVPAQALDEGENPQVQALTQQLQEAGQFIQILSKKLEDKGDELQIRRDANKVNQEKTAVVGYNAQTARLAAIKEALGLDPEGLMRLVKEVIAESIATSDAGAGLDEAMTVETYEDIPQVIPQAMGGPMDDQPPPAPTA